MGTAPTRLAIRRADTVVATLDRAFPLAWIGFYLLLPVSGWATVMFRSWYDQRQDLETLRAVLASGHAPAIDSNILGPAYIAAARLAHTVLGLDAEDSLVVLTRSSYALSVALAMLLVGALVRGLTEAPPLISLAAQFSVGALVFAAGTWHWSDVPWSHFFAAFLAVAFYAARFVPDRVGRVSAALLGVVVSLSALTRTFEFAAVLLAWLVGVLFALILRLGPRPRLAPAALVSAAVAFLATTALVYAATGKRDFFILYSRTLDQQSGNLSAAEVAHTPTFSFGFIPTKLVQLFIEPCYYSLCSLSDYAGGAASLPKDLSGAAGNELLWRLPLVVQLPSLALLPACVVALLIGAVWARRNRAGAAARGRPLLALFEMTVAAWGLVLGYAANTIAGSSHLRYGFARDFLLPALLAAVVGVVLVSVALWAALERGARHLPSSPQFVFVIAAVVGAGVMVGAAAQARAHGIPRLEDKQLGAVSYTAACKGRRCVVSIDAKTRAGEAISIPTSSILMFGCGSNRGRFTLYAETLTEGIQLDRPCRDPRLVAAWPTVMGLPPGRYELGFVNVDNS